MAPDAQQNALVLVVEDNADLNMAICEILESYGYTTASAINGREALDSLTHRTPDIILCDIMMPVMDGYTLLRHTRADSKLRTLPFIFLTARTSSEDRQRAKNIGIEDYLTKPIDESDLVASIQNALRRRQIMDEESVRQLDLLRSQIVGTLQHEFRTPLTFVLGYAEYLLDVTSDEIDIDDLRASASAILEGGHRLQRLIESFLMLADLQNRELRSDAFSTLNAVQLWEVSTRYFHSELESSHLSVEIDRQNADALVSGEATLLNEALRRLLDNAIRYRRPDSRRIWLSVENASTHVGLRIQDESCGISPEQIDRLFKPFEQGDHEHRVQMGAGLSLALVSHIARVHGGSFELTSEWGVGTTCTLWLPAGIDPSELG